MLGVFKINVFHIVLTGYRLHPPTVTVAEIEMRDTPFTQSTMTSMSKNTQSTMRSMSKNTQPTKLFIPKNTQPTMTAKPKNTQPTIASMPKNKKSCSTKQGNQTRFAHYLCDVFSKNNTC